MLRQETVEKRTLDLIKLLMKDDIFMSFNLVGGTALALKLGHRKSLDIDLFTTSDFNSSDIASHLTSTYQAKRIQTIANGGFCFVKGIKIDLLAHKYPLLENIATIDGVRIISLIDIGSMKLNAIYDNGSRLKDFIDLYKLLEYFSLKELLEANEKKYPGNNSIMMKNSLIYFEDVDFSVPIDFLGPAIKWPLIADRLNKAFHHPTLKFGI